MSGGGWFVKIPPPVRIRPRPELVPWPTPMPTPDRLRSSAADAGSDACGQCRVNLPRMIDDNFLGKCNNYFGADMDDRHV